VEGSLEGGGVRGAAASTVFCFPSTPANVCAILRAFFSMMVGSHMPVPSPSSGSSISSSSVASACMMIILSAGALSVDSCHAAVF